MAQERTLTIEQARRFYDRMGARQDWNRFYEDPAVEALIRHSGFQRAHAVVEFGCGTGRLAERLLRDYMLSDARYLALDTSTTMVNLARDRLAPFGKRVEVRETDGSAHIDAPEGTFDRFLSTYVFDLLAREQITALIDEAYRVLAPNGRLCLVSLTHGRTSLGRIASRAWHGVWTLKPGLVGGCRPIELTDFIDAERFELLHNVVVTAYGLSSEAIVALRR